MMAINDRVEITLQIRKDVLKRLQWVAENYFNSATTGELIEMMCSEKDHVALTAFHGFHQSWLYYGCEED